MTRLLDRMEPRALIGTERSREDRRVAITRITGEGLNLATTIDAHLQALLCSLLGHVGQRRLGELVEILQDLREGAQ